MTTTKLFTSLSASLYMQSGITTYKNVIFLFLTLFPMKRLLISFAVIPAQRHNRYMLLHAGGIYNLKEYYFPPIQESLLKKRPKIICFHLAVPLTKVD